MRKFLCVVSLLCLMCGVCSGQPFQKTRLSVYLPEADWGLDFAAPGFFIIEHKIDSIGGPISLRAMNRDKTILIISFEKLLHANNAGSWRDFLFEKYQDTHPDMTQVRKYHIGEMAIFEYVDEEFDNRVFDKMNINGFLSKNGYCALIYLTGNNYTDSMHSEFDEILGRITIIDNPVPNPFWLFNFGEHAFNSGDYTKAIVFYEQALADELKLKDKKLRLWCRATERFGNTYRVIGNYEKAQEVLRKGLEFTEAHPMFFYNLALVYADLKEEDNVLENLALAIENKYLAYRKEPLPNPLEDTSFSKLMENNEFRKKVETLMK